MDDFFIVISLRVFQGAIRVTIYVSPSYKQTRTDLNSLKDLFVRIYA